MSKSLVEVPVIALMIAILCACEARHEASCERFGEFFVCSSASGLTYTESFESRFIRVRFSPEHEALGYAGSFRVGSPVGTACRVDDIFTLDGRTFVVNQVEIYPNNECVGIIVATTNSAPNYETPKLRIAPPKRR